jgi:hypothetical protein
LTPLSVSMRGHVPAGPRASGSAGVVALERALADPEADLVLRLVLFGGEEQGCSAAGATSRSLPTRSGPVSGPS